MKKLVILFFLFVVGLFSVYTQDLIVLLDGNMIESKVQEISPTEIRYKRFDHLDGPTIVLPVANVLSIRYQNGRVETFGTVTTPAPVTTPLQSEQGLTHAVLQSTLIQETASHLGVPTSLQQIFNQLPAIRIAGNNLKFEFTGDTWTARVNGENFSMGTIEFNTTNTGGILTLKQTHIWPGAVGKTAGRVAGRIPGGGTVGSALNTAGSVAEAAGPIETSGEIVLEYKAGPPAALTLLRESNSTNDESTAGTKSNQTLDVGWVINCDPESSANFNIGTETINGQQKEVLTITTNPAGVMGKNWAGITTSNNEFIQKLKNCSGVRFKVQGDGKQWLFLVPTIETLKDSGFHRSTIKTNKSKIISIDISFSKLRQPEWGVRCRFNKNNITNLGIEKYTRGSSTIKIFDFEIY